MKKLFFLLLLPLLLADCKNKDENVLFRVPYQVDLEFPAGLNTIETHVFQVFNIPSRMDSLLSQFNVDKADIQSINPSESQMRITLPGSGYSFIREISINIYNDEGDKEAFFHTLIPLNAGGQLDVFPSLVDAQDILFEETFNLRVELTLREFSPQFIPTRLEFDFKVK